MSEYVPPGYSGQPVPTSTSADAGDARAKGKKRANRGGGTPTRRSTSTAKYLFLAFGLVLALLVVLVLTSRQQTTYVVRVAAPLPALGAVQPNALTAVALPSEAIEPNTFTGSTGDEALQKAAAYATGKWLIYPLSPGQQLRTEAFSTVGQLAVPLAPDERLISVGAKAARSVAGSVRPGDRVDFYVSDASGLTGVIQENVEVVGVSLTPEQFDSVSQGQSGSGEVSPSGVVPPEQIPGTYVIRVKAEQVARFATADTAGRLFLALRGVDAVTPTEGLAPADLQDAICAGWATTEACARIGN